MVPGEEINDEAEDALGVPEQPVENLDEDSNESYLNSFNSNEQNLRPELVDNTNDETVEEAPENFEVAIDDQESDKTVRPMGEAMENKFHNHDVPIPILMTSASINQTHLVKPIETKAEDALETVADQPMENSDDNDDFVESEKFEALDAEDLISGPLTPCTSPH